MSKDSAIGTDMAKVGRDALQRETTRTGRCKCRETLFSLSKRTVSYSPHLTAHHSACAEETLREETGGVLC